MIYMWCGSIMILQHGVILQQELPFYYYFIYKFKAHIDAANICLFQLFRVSSTKEKENVWARVRKFISKPKYEYKRPARKGLSMKILRRRTRQPSYAADSWLLFRNYRTNIHSQSQKNMLLDFIDVIVLCVCISRH